MFIIKDWAGNHCYMNKTWHTLEDAFDFLLEHFPNDDDLSEFYIYQQDVEEIYFTARRTDNE
jgi:hypothetical protein|tara:strand:+ start:835 stop:1020 length:186 start_codon:yes stop_codon:yes gene_type:complete